jgi:hypothetical protein
VGRLSPELWLLHHNTLGTFFYQINMTVSPTHPTFLFPRLKIKLKGRYFDTTEVTEAESQAVLNIFTEYNFQAAFRKWQKHWEWCLRTEGDIRG